MAKTKNTNTSKPAKEKVTQASVSTQRFMDFFFHRYLVIKSAVALFLLVVAFWLVKPVMFRGQTSLRVVLLLYGVALLVCILFMMGEFVVKVARAQKDNVNRYSLLTAVNTILGLTIPLWYFNSISRTLIHLLRTFPNSGSWLCELRWDIVRSYMHANIYWQIDRIAFYTILMAIALFIFGGLLEKLNLRK